MFANSFMMPTDMSDLCRVCLQLPEESQYLDLTTIYDEEENLTYGECFTICTQINLSAGEDLPHHLCKQCGLELQMSYDFHKKIEDSKRIIEQYQMTKVQKAKITELPATSRQPKDLNINEEEKGTTLDLIDEKYVISEVQLEGTEDDCSMHDENDQKYLNDQAADIEILNNTCNADIKLEHQIASHEMEEINENDDHLELDDYQNVEALEEEETETLQIKYGENVTPIQITKFKSVESGEIEEYVEYEEVFDEEKENDMLKEDVDEIYLQEIDEEYTEDHLTWQENVVAVANKEHLPIELYNEDDDEEGEGEGEGEEQEQEERHKNSESRLTTNESSQDESNTNSYNNNNKTNAGRKRHVGSYSCDYCHRVYPNYSRMKTHRRCHEADRPKFSCTHCGRMYATKQARDCHVQTAHEKSGYTCSICGKVFAIRKSLEIHVRYHTGDFPYECKLCDRKFAQACHLNTHINVKHNKIRFSCEYPSCGKYFTSSSSLRNHEYTHGAMPFECEHCQQGHPAKSKLRIHIQRKHGIDMSNEQLERMRKFHIMRSKVSLVQFVDN